MLDASMAPAVRGGLSGRRKVVVPNNKGALGYHSHPDSLFFRSLIPML
jgi:hypothetical protein